MSDWAKHSEYSGLDGQTVGGVTYSATGFTVPLTLNLYNVGAVNPLNNPGGQPSVGQGTTSEAVQARNA